jgi:lipopolysaccharide export LptBFGC system permease protein LptF
MPALFCADKYSTKKRRLNNMQMQYSELVAMKFLCIAVSLAMCSIGILNANKNRSTLSVILPIMSSLSVAVLGSFCGINY